MSDRTNIRRKKVDTSTITNPSLVSSSTPTLANSNHSLSLQSNNTLPEISVQALSNQQDTQSSNERLLEGEAFKQQPMGHDLSRISLRPQAKLSTSQLGDTDQSVLNWVADRKGGIIPAVLQRQCAACEEEEEVQRTIDTPIIQRDETGSLPPVPNYQLTPPSLLQPPDPATQYGLGLDLHLQLDPQLQAMQYVQQQLNPATIRPVLSQINLGLLPTQGATSPGTANSTLLTSNPGTSPTSPPASPSVPAGKGPDTPRAATAGDLLKAIMAVPAIDGALTSLQTQAGDRISQDWRKLSMGEQIGVVSSLVMIGGGALAGVIADPTDRKLGLDQLNLNGRMLPVPGLNWLHLEINTGGDNLMLGIHVDVGRMLPPNLGFGSSSPSAIGGLPQPKPLPGMIQRQEDNTEVGAGQAIAQRIQAASGGGNNLHEGVQQHLEQHLGADLSGVRIHTDSEADRLSQSVNAIAFTTGQDIFFSAGSYNPSSSEGKHLIAHEVVHTVQQANRAVSGTPTTDGVSISNPSDQFEQEAELVAKQVMRMPEAVDIAPHRPQQFLPDHDFNCTQVTGSLQQYPQTSVQRLVIQRDLFGGNRTEREKIDAALKSKDPGDVKAIKDVNRATEPEKLDLIHILAYQGWVGLFDEYKIEEIWGSFGDQMPRIANKEIALWQKCIAGGADLDKLQEVKKLRDKFESDVKDKAAEYLNKNKEYVLQEMQSLGVLNMCVDGQKPLTKEEQDTRLKEIQVVAATVATAQEQVKQLRQIQVGYELETGSDPDFPSYHVVPLDFDPDHPPNAPDGLTDEDIKNNKGKSWKEVYDQWKAPAEVITKAANLYPAIYAAIQESQPGVFSAPGDKVAPIADEKNPELARKAIADVLSATKTKIDESIQAVPNGKPAYYKLDPIHRQFLAGLPSKSGTDWGGNELNKWVANKDLEKHKERDYWIDIGLKTAAAAAFIAIEIATAGSATFFIAAGIGLAATGANAAIDWTNYVELSRASKTNVKDDTGLVDRKQVIEAGAKALESTAQFIAMCAVVGVKGVSGLKRKAPDPDDDPDEFVNRTDNFPYSKEGKTKYRAKSHIDQAGNLCPANADGDGSIISHIRGSEPSKSNSPYTSFSQQEGGKVYGSTNIKVNISRLKQDIANGKVKGVEVIENETIVKEIDQKIAATQKSYDANQTPKNLEKVSRAQLDRENVVRDHEILIKGVIPKDYVTVE